MSYDADAQARAPETSMVKVAVASLMGTVIEFYDFLIYATAAALVFAHVFFPALGEPAGTVASFATLGNTAAALAYSLAAIFGGAVPPLVAAAVTASFGSYAFSVLLALVCLVSVACALALKETRQRDLEDIFQPTATLTE